MLLCEHAFVLTTTCITLVQNSLHNRCKIQCTICTNYALSQFRWRAYLYDNTENPNDEAKITQPAKSVRWKIVCQQAGNAASIQRGGAAVVPTVPPHCSGYIVSTSTAGIPAVVKVCRPSSSQPSGTSSQIFPSSGSQDDIVWQICFSSKRKKIYLPTC